MSEEEGLFNTHIQRYFRTYHSRGETFGWRKQDASSLKMNISRLVEEAKHDLFDHFRRGLIHEGLVKWFGAAAQHT